MSSGHSRAPLVVKHSVCGTARAVPDRPHVTLWRESAHGPTQGAVGLIAPTEMLVRTPAAPSLSETVLVPSPLLQYRCVEGAIESLVAGRHEQAFEKIELVTEFFFRQRARAVFMACCCPDSTAPHRWWDSL